MLKCHLGVQSRDLVLAFLPGFLLPAFIKAALASSVRFSSYRGPLGGAPLPKCFYWGVPTQRVPKIDVFKLPPPSRDLAEAGWQNFLVGHAFVFASKQKLDKVPILLNKHCRPDS